MNILFILFIAVRTCAIAFQCEKGRNGVLCVHEILHQNLSQNVVRKCIQGGRHLVKLKFNDLDSTYGFIRAHYHRMIPVAVVESLHE